MMLALIDVTQLIMSARSASDSEADAATR